ncbi:MAG: DUF2155 domain-containing protein [Azospirillaceae bacterium]
MAAWSAVGLAVLAAFVADPREASAAVTIDRPFAILQALDKITARVERLDVRVGETAAFGTLDVTVRACRTAPPDEPPEDAAFLEIADTPPDEERRQVFSGWMFASSPAVSAMEHPLYDVWVVDCAEQPPRAPEDMGREPRYVLPGNPPLPPALPAGR